MMDHDKKEHEKQPQPEKKPDAVETPRPPQDIDPSEKPDTEHERKKKPGKNNK